MKEVVTSFVVCTGQNANSSNTDILGYVTNAVLIIILHCKFYRLCVLVDTRVLNFGHAEYYSANTTKLISI